MEKQIKDLTIEYLNENNSICWVTPRLRYAHRRVHIDEVDFEHELRLQQMWKCSDGSVKWEWVETVDLTEDDTR
jgi:GT2 family glycosyltransferase